MLTSTCVAWGGLGRTFGRQCRCRRLRPLFRDLTSGRPPGAILPYWGGCQYPARKGTGRIRNQGPVRPSLLTPPPPEPLGRARDLDGNGGVDGGQVLGVRRQGEVGLLASHSLE